jgi:probable phosphoglycerate mutase
MRLLLTRHGHVEGIKPARFRGRAELELTPTGLAQAEAVARRIARQWQPVAIYTSGLQRCVVTGARIGAACGAPSSVLDGLTDLDYGTWQMRTHDEIRTTDPDAFKLWHTAPHLVRFPRGEALQDVVARTSNALRTVLARHRTETVVMVAHDSVNRALLLQLLDQPLAAYWKIVQDPCTLNEIMIDADRIQVLRLNDTSHLPPGQAAS